MNTAKGEEADLAVEIEEGVVAEIEAMRGIAEAETEIEIATEKEAMKGIATTGIDMKETAAEIAMIGMVRSEAGIMIERGIEIDEAGTGKKDPEAEILMRSVSKGILDMKRGIAERRGTPDIIKTTLHLKKEKPATRGNR